jgi:hypothetical protein
MGNNNPEVIIKSRRHVDRRRVEERRLSLKQEYLDHKPERRGNMTNRRISGDRRGLFSEIMDTFWKEAE